MHGNHGRKRRLAKIRREVKRRSIQLRPEGGPHADNGNSASSLRSRQRDLRYLLEHGAPAPEWY